MKRYDTHLHLGNYTRCCEIIEKSEYKEKYKLYSAINLNLIENQKAYIDSLDDFFAIPIIFKEIDIDTENEFISNFCKAISKGIPVTIIGNQVNGNTEYYIWKEHFLLHDYNDWEERKPIYQFINDVGGFLIIHCKDKIRLEYLKLLSEKFSKINFIVAHLGRNANEDEEFILTVLKTFRNSRFYFDVSTITNFKNIIMASKIISTDRLLYGSDYPYVSLKDIEDIRNQILGFLPNAEDILENNFKVLRRQIVKR